MKIATTNSKIFGASHSSQNNNRERISVLLKTETFSCDIFVKMGCPEILLDLQNFTQKYNWRNASFASAKKRALSFRPLWKIDATIRIFGALPFPLKTTERVCKFLRAISLGFNGKRLSKKHYSKNYSLKIKEKNKFFLPQTRTDSICHFIFHSLVLAK